jgi:hypothetical protein
MHSTKCKKSDYQIKLIKDLHKKKISFFTAKIFSIASSKSEGFAFSNFITSLKKLQYWRELRICQ